MYCMFFSYVSVSPKSPQKPLSTRRSPEPSDSPDPPPIEDTESDEAHSMYTVILC